MLTSTLRLNLKKVPAQQRLTSRDMSNDQLSSYIEIGRLHHPPYRSAMASNEFHLFVSLLGWKRFNDAEEVNTCLPQIAVTFHYNGLKFKL